MRDVQELGRDFVCCLTTLGRNKRYRNRKTFVKIKGVKWSQKVSPKKLKKMAQMGPRAIRRTQKVLDKKKTATSSNRQKKKH